MGDHTPATVFSCLDELSGCWHILLLLELPEIVIRVNTMGPTMSIYALSPTNSITMKAIEKLMDKLYEKYDATMPFVIHRSDFLGAMSRMSEFDIFNALFTMFDFKGNDTASYREILAAVAAIMLEGTPAERLENAMDIYDYLSQTGSISRKDMLKVLASINNTASFFGDVVLRTSELEKIVMEVYQRQEEIAKAEQEERERQALKVGLSADASSNNQSVKMKSTRFDAKSTKSTKSTNKNIASTKSDGISFHVSVAPSPSSNVVMEIADCIDIILDHETVERFIKGEGTVRFSDIAADKD